MLLLFHNIDPVLYTISLYCNGIEQFYLFSLGIIKKKHISYTNIIIENIKDLFLINNFPTYICDINLSDSVITCNDPKLYIKNFTDIIFELIYKKQMDNKYIFYLLD